MSSHLEMELTKEDEAEIERIWNAAATPEAWARVSGETSSQELPTPDSFKKVTNARLDGEPQEFAAEPLTDEELLNQIWEEASHPDRVDMFRKLLSSNASEKSTLPNSEDANSR